MSDTRPPSSIRLHILSDLHLGVRDMPVPQVEADVTILAGDIARPEAAMRWAARFERPVVYVAGNHEFYGGRIQAVREELARLATACGVHFLDQQSLVIRGIRFLGTTLWADFQLFGPESSALAMARSAESIRDFKAIHNSDGSPYTPQDACALFHEQYAWLDAALNEPFEGPTVVITHHAPHANSVHPRFADSLVSAGFVSDCTDLMGRAVLWVHGHTHDSFDYRVRGTRVLCNPRGYWHDGQAENAAFNPELCIGLPGAVGAPPVAC